MNLVPLLVPLGGLLIGLAVSVGGRFARGLAIVGTILFGVALVLALLEV